MEPEQPVTHTMSAAAGRPALVRIINVELTVVIMVGAIGSAVAAFTNGIYGLIFVGVVLLFCRILTMIDDQAFRILGVVIRTRLIHFNFGKSRYTSNKARYQ